MMVHQDDEHLTCVAPGIWSAPGARLIDRAGARMLPIGDDGFERAMGRSVLVDKTMLIADVLDSGYTATLFCRPRRFGKTLNMTMMKSFFEIPVQGGQPSGIFEGTCVWEAGDGRYREHCGVYPVIYLSLRTVKKDSWPAAYGALKSLIAAEYDRHAYLLEAAGMDEGTRARFLRVKDGVADEGEYADSLLWLARMLTRHHGRRAVILIDEYDAPVMASYSAPNGGYYRQAIEFLKGWLTGPLKDGGEVLAFACLTGVQRISKESIFSDLNNLVVSTALSTDFDERFGFTDAEVAALSAYLGHGGCMDEARAWYDGYRFGDASVYNPWSVLNYFNFSCTADVYWGNTSGNAVVGDLVRGANEETIEEVYGLLEPEGVVWAPLDLGIVFPEMGVSGDALWSMLYLAGYLTTDDVSRPNDTQVLRSLRIPNLEVARLYRAEIIERFLTVAGGRTSLIRLHDALIEGDAEQLGFELTEILESSASYFDLTSENSVHMLLLGLLFNIRGYADPISNRERGLGRFDIRVEPARDDAASLPLPLITIEVKFERGSGEARLEELASGALGQIRAQEYDAGTLPAGASGRLRWGIACSSKRARAVCEQAR